MRRLEELGIEAAVSLFIVAIGIKLYKSKCHIWLNSRFLTAELEASEIDNEP